MTASDRMVSVSDDILQQTKKTTNQGYYPSLRVSAVVTSPVRVPLFSCVGTNNKKKVVTLSADGPSITAHYDRRRFYSSTSTHTRNFYLDGSIDTIFFQKLAETGTERTHQVSDFRVAPFFCLFATETVPDVIRDYVV